MLPIAQQLNINTLSFQTAPKFTKNSVIRSFLLSAYFLTASSRAARKPPTIAKMIPIIAVVLMVDDSFGYSGRSVGSAVVVCRQEFGLGVENRAAAS